MNDSSNLTSYQIQKWFKFRNAWLKSHGMSIRDVRASRRVRDNTNTEFPTLVGQTAATIE